MMFFRINREIVSSLDYKRIHKQINALERRHNMTTFAEIELLRKKLNHARIIRPKKIPSDIVTMNSKVELEIIPSGNRMTVELVYPYNVDLRNFKISVLSSLGSAILSGKIGDEIAYNTGVKNYTVQIIDIPFQPEASGLYDL